MPAVMVSRRQNYPFVVYRVPYYVYHAPNTMHEASECIPIPHTRKEFSVHGTIRLCA